MIETATAKPLARRYFTRISRYRSTDSKAYFRSTIPSSIAERLGIREGDVFEWQLMADLIILRVSRRQGGESVAAD